MSDAAPNASLAERHAARSLADRHADYVAEIERIVDATYRVIERTGNVDPTMRDILREAGLSTPAFYRHFRSKDELFVALLDDGRRRLAATIERRTTRAATGAAAVRAWVEAVLDQSRDTTAAARTRPFMASVDRLVERYPAEYRVSEELLIDQLVALIDARPDLASGDPRADATALYHLAFGALAWHLRHRRPPRPVEVDRIVDFACRALGATTSTITNKGEAHG